MTQTNKGFTLIELLIVVAIIAILAAIAIPNFLQAQVRAKVTRSMNDLRVLATALESYNVDNGDYPLMALWAHEGGIADIWGVNFPNGTIGDNEMFISQRTNITTPIAYITAEPFDPFYLTPLPKTGPAANNPGMKRYCYSSFKSYQLGSGAEDPNPTWMRPVYGEYRLWGSGPDQDRQDIYVRDALNSVITYDPTNGTISNGDILRCPRSPDGSRPFLAGVVE